MSEWDNLQGLEAVKVAADILEDQGQMFIFGGVILLLGFLLLVKEIRK